jgi:hypothetical protein
MGVVFFVINAAFALILLLMLLVSSGFALFTKNPDTRYQPMRDDRGSFIKSQTQLTTELDALGATARGEGKGTHPSYNTSRSRLDDEDDYSVEQRQLAAKEGGFTEHYAAVPPRSQSGDGDISPAAPSFYDRRSPVPSYQRPPSNGPQYRQANNTSPWQRGAGYDQH